MTYELHVDGPIHTRHEPEVDTRSGRVRFHKHRKTAEGELAWRTAWMTQGRPRIEGPFWLTMQIEVERPRGHLLRDGRTLSAAGRRSDRPTGKPDVDNVVKLVLDALKRVAFGDDTDVVWLKVEKEWSSRSRVTIAFDRWIGVQRELSRDATKGDPSIAA